MEASLYEEKSIKYNEIELVEYKEKSRNYYEEEIKYLKESDIIRFLNGISNEFHKMLFCFLFETGARVSEALGVKISDIDFVNKSVKLHTLKRKNKNIVRILTISDSLLNKILIYEKKKGFKNTDYVFSKKSGNSPITVQAVNNAIKKDFVSILGDEYRELGHPHTLRHSRAIQLLNSGVNIVQVKTILGHANIMNTLVYLKYSNKDIHESMKGSDLVLGIT
ncbi:MAG: site-specific integrase [Clostridia bacterium]|nr:site-specific integrase [Clostridia bacterium]